MMKASQSIKTSLIAAAIALSGCATTNPDDPFESFNRAMFTFNDKVDQAAIKPAAEVYSNVVPQFVQTGVGNFFGNLGDVWTAINNFLQGKVEDGFSDVMRVAVNTTFGFAGVLDIGSEAGLTKHREDFGQTLGKWGVKSGPYIVLPLFGSSTLRDTAAMPLDMSADLWSYHDPVRWRNAGSAVRLIDLRASVLDASNLVEEAALDRYVFVRDAYLQRRESKVFDGDVPSSKYDYDVGPTESSEGASGKNPPAAASEPATEPVVKLEKNEGAGAMPVAETKQ